jgi:hypothetical protein
MGKFKLFTKAIGLAFKAQEAREEFKDAKASGQVSMRNELTKGVSAPANRWLKIRGVAVPAVASFLTAVLQMANFPFEPELVDQISVLIVAAGFIWGGVDGVRVSPAIGVLPQPKPGGSGQEQTPPSK